MKRRSVIFVLGFVMGMILLPLCAWIWVRLGYAPVATAAPPLPLERWLAKTALKATVSREAPRQPVAAPSENDFVAGAKIYKENCAFCHGLIGQLETPAAKGMFPPPPELLHRKGVTDDPVGETYWKVANGIRLTGMPAYRESLSDAQLWQVSQLLAHSTNLPAAATALLQAEAPPK